MEKNTSNITTPETSQLQKLHNTRNFTTAETYKLWNLQNFATPCNPTATNPLLMLQLGHTNSLGTQACLLAAHISKN